MPKKKAKKKGEVKLELIGGVYITETFPDGTERSEEINGEHVLKLVLHAMETVLKEKSNEWISTAKSKLSSQQKVSP